ncbi:MAG: sucrose hydrolase, partial [Pseudomonadota bacterium]
MRSFDGRPAPQEEADLSPALKRQLATAPDSLRLRLTGRLQVHLPLLRDRLHRLYGATPDFEPWFAALLCSVLDWALQRPLPLCQLDQQRHGNPHWHQAPTMLAYSAYVDRFAGKLDQVAQRIPHLQDLGVRYLHLLPFLRARHGANDGGFAVASFEEVEPRLGTISDLRSLTDQLRQANISLCADLVLNHVADDHPWALAAQRNDPHYRAYFHVFDTPEQVRHQEAHLNQVFPQTAPGNFTYVPALQGWVWTTFYSYQWDLNYAHPAVFADMVSALLRLANLGVEAFRLDSTAYLWKRNDTTCMNQPEVHWLLQAMRCVVDIAAPGVLLKAEAIVPTRELPPYFGQAEAFGRECQVAYHSSLMAAAWVALAEQNAELVHEVLRN